MDNAEIKQRIESSFGPCPPCPPYYCGVEFIIVNGDEGLGIEVSDEDDTLPVYRAEATLRALRTNFDWHITTWREGATKLGYQFDPL